MNSAAVASLVWHRAFMDMLRGEEAVQHGLKPTDIAILMVFVDFADNRTGSSIRPSIETLAKISQAGTTSVSRALKRALDLHLVEQVRTGGYRVVAGRRTNFTSEYRLTHPAMWQVPGFSYEIPGATIITGSMEVEAPVIESSPVTAEPVESVPSLPVYEPAFEGPDLEVSHGDPLLNEWFEEQKRQRQSRPVTTARVMGGRL